jgi:hypothetical protein
LTFTKVRATTFKYVVWGALAGATIGAATGAIAVSLAPGFAFLLLDDDMGAMPPWYEALKSYFWIYIPANSTYCAVVAARIMMRVGPSFAKTSELWGNATAIVKRLRLQRND